MIFLYREYLCFTINMYCLHNNFKIIQTGGFMLFYYTFSCVANIQSNFVMHIFLKPKYKGSIYISFYLEVENRSFMYDLLI